MRVLDKVVSVDVARELNEKLKSAGIEPCGCYAYIKNTKENKYNVWARKTIQSLIAIKGIERLKQIGFDVFDTIHTYTLTEMLDMLPEWIEPGELYYHRTLLPGCIRYHNVTHNHVLEHSSFYSNSSKANALQDDNAETACAKPMIWLIDNDYIKETPCKNG